MKAICWISSARYGVPLDTTTQKKWNALAQGLSAKLIVIGFAQTMRPRIHAEHAQFYLLPQFPVSILRYLTIYLLAPLIGFYLVIRKDVRVFIAQSPYEGTIGAFLKRFFGIFGIKIQLIVESHNDFEGVLFLQRKISFQGMYKGVMHRFAQYALHHADLLRCVSTATREQLRKYASDKPVHQFIAWTDQTAFREVERSVPIEDSFDVIYAGVLVPGKGVHHLLTAFAKLSNQKGICKLIGHANNPTYQEALQIQAQELGIRDRVQFLGKVPQTELARQIASSRVLVLPSLSEAFGLVLIEAMLCGTPVIASAVGGIMDIVQEGMNGYLVAPNDAKALQVALEQMMTEADVALMSKNAQQFAEDFFADNSYVAGHQQMLAEVMPEIFEIF